MGFYNCPYILRSGEVCNEGCYRVEGCRIHWKSPKKNPCIECGKMTRSEYKACRDHAGKYRIKEFYHRKKIAKFDQLSNEIRTRTLNVNILGSSD